MNGRNVLNSHPITEHFLSVPNRSKSFDAVPKHTFRCLCWNRIAQDLSFSLLPVTKLALFQFKFTPPKIIISWIRINFEFIHNFNDLKNYSDLSESKIFWCAIGWIRFAALDVDFFKINHPVCRKLHRKHLRVWHQANSFPNN